MSVTTNSQTIKLNLGGTLFETTKTTLCFVPNSSLAVNIVGRNEKLIESGQPIFIDRDPKAFEHVLNLLRDTRYSFPDEYRYELEYYGLVEPRTEAVSLNHQKEEMKVGPENMDELCTRPGYNVAMLHLALDDEKSALAFPKPSERSERAEGRLSNPASKPTTRPQKETKTFYSINTEAWTSIVRNKAAFDPVTNPHPKVYGFKIRSPDFISSPCVFVKLAGGRVCNKHEVIESVSINFSDQRQEIPGKALYLAQQFYIGPDSGEPASDVWCIPLPFFFHPQFSHNLSHFDAYKCALPVRLSPYTSVTFEVRLYPDTPDAEVVYLLSEDILANEVGRDSWRGKIWRYPNYTYYESLAVLAKGTNHHDFELPIVERDLTLVEVWYYLTCSGVKTPVNRLRLMDSNSNTVILDVFEKEVTEQMRQHSIRREENIYCWRYRGCGLAVSRLGSSRITVRINTDPIQSTPAIFSIVMRYYNVCLASSDYIGFVGLGTV